MACGAAACAETRLGGGRALRSGEAESWSPSEAGRGVEAAPRPPCQAWRKLSSGKNTGSLGTRMGWGLDTGVPLGARVLGM